MTGVAISPLASLDMCRGYHLKMGLVLKKHSTENRSRLQECGFPGFAARLWLKTGNESVPKIIINDIIKFLY